MESILADRYHLVKHLGGGGFGQTFLAQDNHLPGNPLCVVKQLKPKLTEAASQLMAKRLFEREAATLYKLGEHPQIPRLLAHFSQAGEFYLVQEYIEGNSLDREIIPEQPWSQNQALNVLEDLLEVLAFVHQNNVIHRDIKPANLIHRFQDQRIVLIDFGAVKEVRNYTGNTVETNTFTVAIGSPGYMPGEQQAARPHFSSDLYAVGIIILQALTGLSPHNLPRDINDEISCQLLGDRLQITPAFADFLDLMVRYDYRQRYPNATTALEVLKSLNLSIVKQKIKTPTPATNITATTVIHHSFSPLPPTTPPPENSLSREELRNRQVLLNKVKNYWIKGVLEASLHGRVLMELGLAEKPEALQHPWRMVWESNRENESLPSGLRIIEKFDELGVGRTLLILGQPGAGKTTTLLELARDLIARSEGDLSQPIPVIFNLSSWREKQTIKDWLVNEFYFKYQVSQEISQDWLSKQQVLLLLDGLDEVQRDCRQSCVEFLNQFVSQYGQTEIVVCSRLQDYETLSTRLNFQGAVYIQPLTLSQIRQYLASIGSGLTAISNALTQDTTLQELAQSPLMLSIMTLAYQGRAIEELPSHNLTGLRDNLFDAYLERMFTRRVTKSPYSQHQAKRWLIFLAQQMQQESQTVFLIERMQPSWLKTKVKQWQYALCVGLMGGLIAGFCAGFNIFLILGLRTGIIAGFIFGISGGLLAGIIFGFSLCNVEPVEMIKWSTKKAKKNILPGLRIGLMVAVASDLCFLAINLIFGWIITWQEAFFYTLSGLGTGLIFILLQGLIGGGIQTHTIPNQGIKQSFSNMAFFSLIGVCTLATMAGLVGLPLLFGAIVGLFFGIASPAGIACLQHFVLRCLLYREGVIPWNYARFLDEATQLIFMQKVGGGYIFIHRLLLEHFAAAVCSD